MDDKTKERVLEQVNIIEDTLRLVASQLRQLRGAFAESAPQPLALIPREANHKNTRRMTDAEKESIIAEAKTGASLEQIGKKYGFARSSVYQLCRRNGIERRKARQSASVTPSG